MRSTASPPQQQQPSDASKLAGNNAATQLACHRFASAPLCAPCQSYAHTVSRCRGCSPEPWAAQGPLLCARCTGSGLLSLRLTLIDAMSVSLRLSSPLPVQRARSNGP
jgi:hypothetical protein